MPEENFFSAVPVKVKKSGRKTVKRKKTAKPAFELDSQSAVKPVMPQADFKAEQAERGLKPRQARSIYGKLAFSFVALTAILLGAAFYLNFSSATIIIIPAREKISDSSTVEVVNQVPSAALVSGQIAGAVKQVPVELSRAFSASGKQVLGQEVTGNVTVINNYIKNQPLVASTRLLSADGKLFRLKNTVNVPAGGKVRAEVYADEAKPEMAIGPAKFIIPGLWAGLQDKIFAQSSAAMKYNEKIKYAIEQSDIDKAVKELKQKLLAQARKQIGQAYSDYDQLLLAADDNSVSREVSGKVGEEKQNFTVKMKILVNLAAFKSDDVFSQLKAKLAAGLADDKEIAEFSPKDLAYELENFNLNRGSASVKVTAAAQTVLKNGASIIRKSALAGLSLVELKAYLDRQPEVAGYEIKFFPSFIKKVPTLADRIEIVIKK